MKNKFLSLFLIAFICVLFTSCIKDNVDDLEEGDGSSFLKLTQAPENKLFFTPFTDNKTVSLLTIRRDVTSNSELNTAMSVKIEVNADSVTSYNTKHNTHYDPLPDSLYTLGAGVSRAGNIYTINLAPGEFEKDVTISLNGSKWDLSHVYALAFKVTDPGGLKVSSGYTEVISLLSIKNAYDGIFSVVSGTVTRYTAPGSPANDALSGNIAGNPDVTLATVGPNTVEISGLQWAYGNNSGVAGINNLQATVDPATNLVTMKALGNATLTNWEGKINKYDPATKTFYLGFIWNPTANVRTYEMVVKYKGSR